MSRKLVYVAAPLGDGADRPKNLERAAKWVAWAAEQGVAPVCTWIVLASQWDESRRDEGLAIDCALIERCDEVWACGPRVSPGMNVELTHAKNHNIPVHLLVNPELKDGPPQRKSTFEELSQPTPPDGKVVAHMKRMAGHHGVPYEDFLRLSQVQVVALELDNPTPKPTLATPAPYPPGMGEEPRRLHREYNKLVEAQLKGEKNGAEVIRLTDECAAKGVTLVPGGDWAAEKKAP